MLQIQIQDLFDPASGMEKIGSGINIPKPRNTAQGKFQVHVRKHINHYKLKMSKTKLIKLV
jgi:hypothetical protein